VTDEKEMRERRAKDDYKIRGRKVTDAKEIRER
jgi:hypothetical protein